MSHERMTHGAPSAPSRLTLNLDNLHCLPCAEELEKALLAHAHITRARVDFDARTIDVGYHAGVIDGDFSCAPFDDTSVEQVWLARRPLEG